MEKSHRLNLIFACLGLIVIFCSGFTGLVGGFIGYRLADSDGLNDLVSSTISTVHEESAIIEVAEKASPAVVSIVITKDLPVYEEYLYEPFGDYGFSIPRRRQTGTEEQQIGAGSGFLVSPQGLILTNRHVVSDTEAHYTVIFNDGTQLDAEVLDRDTLLDIAMVQVKAEQDLPYLKLGDSDNLQIGQTAIAIGNSLGEFSNTVSTGIISGLSRSIIASDSTGSSAEQLSGVIQTDASINPGNSGGPLLDIGGNVIGVNVAVAQNAENIGFAIPINSVKKILDSVQRTGKIVRPYLGVRYLLLDAELAQQRGLSVTSGALVVEGDEGEPAIVSGSPAEAAGLRVGDIITKIDDQVITQQHTLQTIIQNYNVDDSLTLEVVRGEDTITLTATLAEQE